MAAARRDSGNWVGKSRRGTACRAGKARRCRVVTPPGSGAPTPSRNWRAGDSPGGAPTPSRNWHSANTTVTRPRALTPPGAFAAEPPGDDRGHGRGIDVRHWAITSAHRLTGHWNLEPSVAGVFPVGLAGGVRARWSARRVAPPSHSSGVWRTRRREPITATVETATIIDKQSCNGDNSETVRRQAQRIRFG